MSAPQIQSNQIQAAVQMSVADLNGVLAKFESGQAHIAVMGLGYVGLPLAVVMAEAGFKVTGFDLDVSKAERVNSGKSCVKDVLDREVADAVESKRLSATSDPAGLANADAIIIAVPTPLTSALSPDLSYIEAAGETIAQILKPGMLVCLESTTYPGTTEEVLQPILERSGLIADRDFYLAHSPERVDPGNKKFQTKNTPKVVGGVGPNSLSVAVSLYGKCIDELVPVSNARSAELVKVYENVFRAVNVGMANELALLCDRMGLNVWEVLDAAYTKPFGIMAFYPGPGVGGHCIPLDPHYLEFKAREYNFQTRFITAAGEVNRYMPRFVIEKAIRALNEQSKSVRGSRILVLGVAYKKDVDDYRESPSLEVIRELLELGARVSYVDPHVPEFHEHGLKMSSVEFNRELFAQSDLVILATDHSDFDIDEICEHSITVLDTRNASKHLNPKPKNLILL